VLCSPYRQRTDPARSTTKVAGEGCSAPGIKMPHAAIARGSRTAENKRMRGNFVCKAAMSSTSSAAIATTLVSRAASSVALLASSPSQRVQLFQ
jgi:hypothetical protein